MIDIEDALFVANSVLSEIGLILSTSNELVIMDDEKIEGEISKRCETLKEFKNSDGEWEYSNK